MRRDDDTPLEEELVPLLAACDEALAAGVSAASSFCDGETPEVRERLERDLACVNLLRQLWTRPAVPPSGELPFTRLGRFEIRRELGQGGYGIVFLAWDPNLGREVALKVPRADILVTPELRERFRQEARAAAGLDHPHIVPVYDAGEVGPISFIASAYCPGITLAQWLKEQSAPVACDEAAALVAILADAVQHAHSRGVLHRDLKPANVLMQNADCRLQIANSALKSEISNLQSAIAKIADFGLAKIVTGAPASATQSGAVVGTPSYMAPEQARGESKNISTAADVYGLGAILYELLTGRPPFQADTALDTLVRVMHDEPVPPHRLRPGLPRDLETICLKCLQKEPERRYASAAALGDDLRRFLSREPVQARPVGTAGRLLRWYRRKPALATLAAALILVFIGGFAGVAWQAVRAERHLRRVEEEQIHTDEARRKAHQAVNDYFTKVSQNKLLDRPGFQSLRRELLETALAYYEDFLHERGDEPELRQEVAATWYRVAALTSRIRSKEEAQPLYAKAIELFESLARDFPDEVRYKASTAESYQELARLQADTGRTEAALAGYQHAIDTLQPLATEQHPDLLASLAGSHNDLGVELQRQKHLPEALKAHERAREIRERLVASSPERASYRSDLSNSLANIGLVHLDGDDRPEAIDFLKQSRDVMAELVRREPSNMEFRASLSRSHGLLGSAYFEDRNMIAARASLVEARNVTEKLVYDNPAVLDFQHDLAGMSYNIGVLLMNNSELPEAMRYFDEARPLYEKLRRLDPMTTDYALQMARLEINRGHIQSMRGRPAETMSAFQQARAILEELVAAHPKDAVYRVDLGIITQNMGNECRKSGRMAEAVPFYQRSLELREGLVAEFPKIPLYQRDLAKICNNFGYYHQLNGDPTQARAFCERARQLCETLVATDPSPNNRQDLALSCFRLGELAAEAGKPEEAEPLHRRALDIRKQVAEKDPGLTRIGRELAMSENALGRLEHHRGRYSEAQALHKSAADQLARLVAKEPEDLDHRSELAQALEDQALASAKLGRPADAVDLLRQAVDNQKSAVAKDPQPAYRRRLDRQVQTLAQLYRDLGRPQEAAALAREFGAPLKQ
jgi:tetratricopeptide (TPR) repeat protein